MPKNDNKPNGRERYVPSSDHLHELVNREAPAATNAERGLLSCLMLDHQCYPAVAEILGDPEAFYNTGYSILYAEIAALIDAGAEVDIVTLADRLKLRGYLNGLGGTDGLVDIYETEARVSIPLAVERAKVIAEAYGRRRLADLGSRMLYDAHQSKLTLDKLIDSASRDVLELGKVGERQSATTGEMSAGDLMQQVYDELMSDEGAPIGISTGFIDLDEITSGGLHDGELTILAARPSMGKSALAVNMAENMAVDKGIPVGVFSLEMNKRDIAWRMLSSRANVELRKIRKCQFETFDLAKLEDATKLIAAAPLHIDDTPGLSLMGLRNRARRMVSENGVRAIFIDYLQLMTDPGAENRLQEVSAISRGLKSLARELGTPVVCLSQLNRASEQRDGHRPRMSDLRESGAIEQDADVIAFVHRPDYYHRNNPDYDPTNEAEVIIAKQRNGPTETVRLIWDGVTTTFSNRALSGQVAHARERNLLQLELG